jgi:hypothetical protein
LAESGRADGFQILSLGYAEGPTGQMSHDALFGRSTVGLSDLVEDVRVTEAVAGLRHYITDARIALVNSFVVDHTDLSDTAPPVWTSSYNNHNPGYPTPPSEASARVGVREIVAGSRQLTVRWDVALDKYPVGYAVYYQTTPFDFAADPRLTRATRVEAAPRMPINYPGWGGATIVANETTLTGLVAGQTTYVVVRAFDRSPARNEDQNQIVLSGVPGA